MDWLDSVTSTSVGDPPMTALDMNLQSGVSDILGCGVRYLLGYGVRGVGYDVMGVPPSSLGVGGPPPDHSGRSVLHLQWVW